MNQRSDSTTGRRHLIIAGTGRSGTTFLVRYLSALGLDTHLSRRGDSAWLDEQAQAGLEDFPLGPDAADLPYVIKNPMLYEFVDQVLGDGSITLDGVIIPVRNLREATSSRVILERRSMYEHLPWLGTMEKAWGTTGHVPGGLIYSLSALDEARTLSMGLHLLVERLVHANVPMVFVDFPRIITDGDYLFEKLAPFLPATTRETARAVHVQLADPDKVRIEREFSSSPDASRTANLDEDLDRIALRRELTRLRAEVVQLRESEKGLSATTSELQANLEAAAREASILRAQIEDLEKLRARAITDASRVRADLQLQSDELSTLHARHDELQQHFDLIAEQLNGLIEERTELDAYAKRVAGMAIESRRRMVEAERATHDYLSAFADDLSSVAARTERVVYISALREQAGLLIDQLEAADAELADLRQRVARHESGVGWHVAWRVQASNTLRKLRSIAGSVRGQR